jgi:hypothetical protein
MIKYPATEKSIALSMMKKISKKNKTGRSARFFLCGGSLLKTAPSKMEPIMAAPSKVMGMYKL